MSDLSATSGGSSRAPRKTRRHSANIAPALQLTTFSGPFQHLVVRPHHETYCEARVAITAEKMN